MKTIQHQIIWTGAGVSHPSPGPGPNMPPGLQSIPEGDGGAWFPFGVKGNGEIAWRRPLMAIPTATNQGGPPHAEQGVPRWARQAAAARNKSAVGKLTTGMAGTWTAVKASHVMAAAIACIEQVTQKIVNPERAATAAKPVISLWKAEGYPPLKEFVADVRLIARAARGCPWPLFARDIRAVGWEGGTDRSQHISTLCVQAKWTDRLNTARQWENEGEPTAPVRRPALPGGRGDTTTEAGRDDDLNAWREQV